MRDFKGMKRQRSRNRNPGGGGGGGAKPQQHNANRAFDSNGPEGIKVRGAAQSVYEKYQQLARDAQTAGDRVLAENYLQHAEHYFRLIRAMQPLRPLSEIIGRDQFVSGYDIDFEDESMLEAAEAAEAQAQAQAQIQEQAEAADPDRASQANRQNDYQRDRPRDDRYQGDRYQNDRPQNDRPQNDRPQNDRYQGGQDRQQNDRSQNERSQNDRYQGGQDRQQGDRPRYNNRDDRNPRNVRDDRPRDDRPREDRPREERPRYDRDERPREDRPQPTERVEAEIAYAAAPSVEVVETRTPEPTSVLRADDGEVSAAPAFLQTRPAESGEETRRPRRRRAPATFEPTASPEPSAED